MKRALILFLTMAACSGAASHATESPEDKLSCSVAGASGDDQGPKSRPFTKNEPKSITNAVERSRLITSVLAPKDQTRLDAANTKEKIQALVLDVMNRTDSQTHQYSLTGPRLCALTKRYADSDYRESVCLHPSGVAHGNNGDILARKNGEDAFRKTITLWLVYANCTDKRCAVYTEGTKSEYMDSYFFGASFPDENTTLLAAKALTKLAEVCELH